MQNYRLFGLQILTINFAWLVQHCQIMLTRLKQFTLKKVYYHGFFSQTNNSQPAWTGRTLFTSLSTTSTSSPHSDIYSELCMWDKYHVF